MGKPYTYPAAQPSARAAIPAQRTIADAGLLVETAIVAVVSAVACAALVLSWRQDINWDQLNYHVYSVYALFHNRFEVDIAAGQMQTWNGPFGNILQYTLIQSFSPRAASLILAVLSSTTIPLIYLLTRKSLTSTVPRTTQILVAAVAALCAFASPLFLSEVGTTFNDYFLSILIFSAFYILVRGGFQGRSCFIAGVLIGVACGVKLTNVLFLFAWLVAIVVATSRGAIRPLVATGLGAALAYLPTGGIWNFYLYKLFGNPIFPNYNNIFRSPAYSPTSMADTRFVPASLADAVQDLAKMALGLHPTSELIFFDARFLLAGLLLVLAAPRVVALLANVAQANASPPFERQAGLFLLSFFVVAFFAWLLKFGIERYAVMLEQLAPLIALILLSLLCADRRVWAESALMLGLLILATSRPTDWGRVPFGKSWYAEDIPPELRSGGTLFVMLSSEPISYVIPALPPSDAFLRIEGNMPLDPSLGLGALALGRIRAHQGEIRSLAPADYDPSRSREHLASFGLASRGEDCLLISTKAGKLQSCRLTRL